MIRGDIQGHTGRLRHPLVRMTSGSCSSIHLHWRCWAGQASGATASERHHPGSGGGGSGSLAVSRVDLSPCSKAEAATVLAVGPHRIDALKMVSPSDWERFEQQALLSEVAHP